MILLEFENAEDGILVRVCVHVRGFSVTIQDTDSGGFLPSVAIFPLKVAAIAYAESIAAGLEPR